MMITAAMEFTPIQMIMITVGCLMIVYGLISLVEALWHLWKWWRLR